MVEALRRDAAHLSSAAVLAGAMPEPSRADPVNLDAVIPRTGVRGMLALAALLAFPLAACHREENPVEIAAHKAERAEHQSRATQTELDQERAQLAQIPLPTKSLYIDIHDPAAWANPFLSVGPDTVNLRILLPDANPSPAGQGSLLRPVAARRQELELRLDDLDQAIVAIPAGAWHYGRVVAVAESPEALPKERPMVRRNLEAVIRKLNDLGVVVEEWPSR